MDLNNRLNQVTQERDSLQQALKIIEGGHPSTKSQGDDQRYLGTSPKTDNCPLGTASKLRISKWGGMTVIKSVPVSTWAIPGMNGKDETSFEF